MLASPGKVCTGNPLLNEFNRVHVKGWNLNLKQLIFPKKHLIKLVHKDCKNETKPPERTKLCSVFYLLHL